MISSSSRRSRNKAHFHFVQTFSAEILDVQFIGMQGSSASDSSNFFTKAKRTILIVIVVALLAFIGVFVFGSQAVHRDTNHLLYDAFKQSPNHQTLLQDIAERKLSIIIGRKEAGVFQFAEHYANTLSLEGHNVFVQDISKKHFKLYRIAKAARTRLDKWFGLQKEEGDWFIYSRDGNIVGQDIIDKISQGNPNSKIIIVTTSIRQRNKGFKEYKFPEIDEHEIQEAIERNFQVSQNTADILYDYFETPQNAFIGMNFQKFSHQAFLGDHFRSLQGLSKEDNRILKDLCKKGEGFSGRESLALTELGVVFYQGENYWRNSEARLNYELHKNLNCKNKLIPQDVLRDVQEMKEREAQEQRAKEEQERKKHEEKEKLKGKEKKGKR